MKSLLPGIFAGLLAASSVVAGPIAPSLKGDLVALSKSGKSTQRFDDASLANTKYFAVYFSAHWCGPCRAFTPDLVQWYQAQKPKHPEFELIFVSSDHDEKAMEEYMAGEKMPWPALKYSKVRTNKSLRSLAGRGIPCLVLIDADGKVLSHSYEGQTYVGPRKVMADMDNILGSGSAAAPETSASATTAAESTNATPAKPGTYAPKGSSFDQFFKKKTP